VCAHVTDDERTEILPVAPPPRLAVLWVVAFVALVVCTNLAAAFWATLIDDRPAALLALSSRNRYLVLTVPSDIGPTAWAIIAAARIGIAAIVCHFVGRAYGDRALRWFWRFLGMPEQQVRKFEEQVSRAEWVVVPVFVGSNIVWALTGAAKTSWRRLVPMFAVGMAVRLALLWWLAHQFEPEVKSVINFTNRYQLWIIGISIGVVVLANVRNFRKGG
jgi:membrane protein DedA with SNARE-associated domain